MVWDSGKCGLRRTIQGGRVFLLLCQVLAVLLNGLVTAGADERLFPGPSDQDLAQDVLTCFDVHARMCGSRESIFAAGRSRRRLRRAQGT
ncbi:MULTISPECIES: hypothetical protein [Streptomyces]|uniref:Secreted protein n=1 Tax=Streptomyces canarius TaxID=285453 RepID=A0ABQ3DAU7_9ACTN|nr:hypothetical protein [Streptomyces canarius]GHA71264.1 hypothetical protein GCM10010345_88000 [Streptomyces canarius]